MLVNKIHNTANMKERTLRSINFFTSNEDCRKKRCDWLDANPCCMRRHQMELFLVAVISNI